MRKHISKPPKDGEEMIATLKVVRRTEISIERTERVVEVRGLELTDLGIKCPICGQTTAIQAVEQQSHHRTPTAANLRCSSLLPRPPEM